MWLLSLVQFHENKTYWKCYLTKQCRTQDLSIFETLAMSFSNDMCFSFKIYLKGNVRVYCSSVSAPLQPANCPNWVCSSQGHRYRPGGFDHRLGLFFLFENFYSGLQPAAKSLPALFLIFPPPPVLTITISAFPPFPKFCPVLLSSPFLFLLLSSSSVIHGHI